MQTTTTQPHKKKGSPQVYIPASWYKAAGMLRRKRKALELHLKNIRREWDRTP